MDGRRESSGFRGEGGSALIAVLVVTLLGTLVLGSLSRSMIEAELAGREIEASEAFYHAEAGLQHALAVLLASDPGLGDDLLGPDGREGTDDDGYILGTAPIPFGEGSYLVRVVNNWAAECDDISGSGSGASHEPFCDDGSGDDDGDSDSDGFPDPLDSDGVAEVWALGIAGEARAAIRARVDADAGGDLGPGIYTNGVIFSGNGAEVYASGTKIHGNGGLILRRNSSIHGSPGTSADAEVWTGTEINGESLDSDAADAYAAAHGDLPTVTIPDIVPADYAHLADYRFAADGKVYDAAGNQVASGQWNSWRFSGGSWKLNNVRGRYEPMTAYFETDVSVTAQDEVVTTIISEGSVSMNGGRMQAAVDDLLVVAGGDLSIGGNADSSAYRGNILVREQVRTFGTSGVRGSIVAQDAADDHGLVRGHAIQLGSEIHVDPASGSPFHSTIPAYVDWFLDVGGAHRAIFR